MSLRSFVSCTSLSNSPSLIKLVVIKLFSPIPEFLQVSTTGRWRCGVISGRIRREGTLTQIIRLSAPTVSKNISKTQAELQRKQKGFLQTPPDGKSGRNTQRRGNGWVNSGFQNWAANYNHRGRFCRKYWCLSFIQRFHFNWSRMGNQAVQNDLGSLRDSVVRQL